MYAMKEKILPEGVTSPVRIVQATVRTGEWEIAGEGALV